MDCIRGRINPPPQKKTVTAWGRIEWMLRRQGT